MNKKEIEKVYKKVHKYGGCKLPDGCTISKFQKGYQSWEYTLRDPYVGVITVTWDWRYIAELLKED